jgi:two-component sensor histidine kinase
MKQFLIHTFLILFITGGFAKSPGFIDSLLVELEFPQISDSQKIEILLRLCYYSINEPEEALLYGHEAISLAQKHEMKKQEAYAHGYIGRAQNNMGDYVKGIASFTLSAELFRDCEMYNEEGFALGAIASIFSRNDDFYNAISYNREALSVFEKHNDSISIATALLNIGESYRNIEVYDSAEYYYDKSYGILSHVSPALDSRVADNMWLITGNLGLIYSKQERFDEAQIKLSRAYDYFLAQGEQYRSLIYHAEIGKILVLKGHYEKGESLIQECLKIAHESSLKKLIRDLSRDLSLLYEGQGMKSKALQYYKQYKAYDDTLKDVDNIRQMEQMQSRYQITKREEEIEILNRINRLQRRLAYFLFGSILVFLVSLFLLFSSNRRIRKAYILLAEQKKLVEQKEEEKALLLKELNHRVKNNLQMVASLLSLHARQLKGHPASEALIEGKYRVEALTLIHQKLYRDDVDTVIDIKSYIKELTENLVMNFGHHFKLDMKLQPFFMKIDKAIPLGLVLNELLTNSLKYGGDNEGLSTLNVDLQNDGEEVKIHIYDNGKGMPDDFDMTKSKSFGLKLVHSLIKQVGGVVEYKKGEGAHWVLSVDTEDVI